VPSQTSGYIDYYHVVRGTDTPDAAEEFVDFLLDPEVQTAYAAEFNLGMSHADATYPTATAENVPTTNDELSEVAFQNFARVADYSGDLSDRFRALVQDS
jgi:spermidine/putrescine transport system substrate-binding protein